MKISDATKLAYTKYRAKKARSILTVIGSSFLVAILLFVTLAGTGLRNSVNQADTTRGLRELYLAKTSNFSPTEEEGALDKGIQNELRRLDIAGIKPKTMYKGVLLSTASGIQSDDLTSTESFFGATIGLELQDKELMSASVVEEVDLTQKTSSGAIPILVTIDTVASEYKRELNAIKDQTKRQKRLNEIKADILSRDIAIKFDINETELKDTKYPDGSSSVEVVTTGTKSYEQKVRVVGFLPDPASFLSSLSDSLSFFGSKIVLPIELAMAEDYGAKVKDTSPTDIYASMDNAGDRDQLLDEFGIESTGFSSNSTPYVLYGDVVASVEKFTGSIRNIFKGFIIVMLLFVTLPMSGTISKVLADAQRETGVFRAIGAKSRDIFQIYFTYSAMLALLAFVVAFFIASLICAILTFKYGPSLSAELSAISGGSQTYSVMLFGVNILHVLFIYILITVSAMLGVIGPVLKTLRRDPVVAMRED